jgi:hypothetical protein
LLNEKTIEAKSFINNYKGNSLFVNSLKCRNFLSEKQVNVVLKIKRTKKVSLDNVYKSMFK